MRKIGTISDAQQAESFADYLLVQGVASKLDQEQDGWAVWIRDEQDVVRSRQELAQFLGEPNDSRYRDSRATAEEIRRDEVKAQRQHTQNVVSVRRRWQSGGGNTPVTWTILGLMLLATVASNFGSNRTVFRRLCIADKRLVNTQTGQVVEHFPDIWKGQIWRLFTPALMHGNVIHLIFGMYMFFQFGRIIEWRRGSWRLLGLTLVIAVSSNLAEYWFADFIDWPNGIIQPSAAFLGMSGVIYGLFGYAWMRGKFDPTSGLRLNPQTVFILIAWLVVCLTGFMPIANIAHVSGLLVGMAFGYFPLLLRRVA